MKPKTTASLKKKLDQLWSEWIRRKDAVGGMATCVTCGAVKRWQEQQCGHFVSRVHLSTRWLEQNTAVQCYACNCLRGGNFIEYAVWMEKNWGWQTIRDLREMKHQTLKITRAGYLERIEEVKQKLAELDEFAEAA